MAKTLLNGVNEILRRVSLIAGDAGALTSLTDTARQVFIDVAVQAINEGIGELYSSSGVALPQGQGESTITLATGTRAYSLAADLVSLRYPLIDKTHNQYLLAYPGGYNAMLIADPEQDDTGLPHYGAIRPTDGKLHLDRAPGSDENGRVYTYQYDKSLLLDAAADTMPFSDDVFTAMVPAWVQIYKREKRNEFDGSLFKAAIGQAARKMPQVQPRSSYLPR